MLFTFNKGDFLRLHQGILREGRSHGGIVVCEQRRFGAGEIIRRLTRLGHALDAASIAGRVEF